ncbi:NAD-dependent epimerase/dehydratase family protein, partial [Streptococcus suis]
YGPPQIVPIPEEHKLEPTTSYGITKAAIEKFIHLFQQRDGLDSIILRLSNPYGPGQKTHGTQGVIAAFAYRILNDLPIELWGDGSTIRDFIYIDDAINGLMASINYSGTHRVF